MQRLQPINVGQQANDRTAIAARRHGQGERELHRSRPRSTRSKRQPRRATAGRCGARQGVGVNAPPRRRTERRWQRRSRQPLAWPPRRRPTAGRRGPGRGRRSQQEGGRRQCGGGNGGAVRRFLAAASEADRKALANAAAVVADGKASRPRKPPPWPRPPPMRPIKRRKRRFRFPTQAYSRRGHAGRPLATLADAQIPHVTTATVWDDANWNELPHARNDGLVMRLIRSGGSSQNASGRAVLLRPASLVRRSGYADADCDPVLQLGRNHAGVPISNEVRGRLDTLVQRGSADQSQGIWGRSDTGHLAGQRLPGHYVNSTRKPISVYLYGSTAAGGYINILMASIPVAVFFRPRRERHRGECHHSGNNFASAVNAKDRILDGVR